MTEGGVGFRAAIGHRKNAEARWLLPMICRAGGLTKQDIGAIRIMDTTTEFEITAGVADAFAAAIKRPDKEDPTSASSFWECGKNDRMLQNPGTGLSISLRMGGPAAMRAGKIGRATSSPENHTESLTAMAGRHSTRGEWPEGKERPTGMVRQ